MLGTSRSVFPVGKEANVTGFVNVRLASLTTGSAATFLGARHDLDMARLLRTNVIIELDDVGDDTDKAVVMGAFLMRLTQQLRLQRTPGQQLRHLTIIEEAHRLLRRTDHHGAAATAVETFAAMLAEIRAYGEGLIIADQIPAKLIPDVIKNTSIKVIHRLPGRDDRDAVGAAMNLTDEQSSYLVSLPPGRAAVATDGMRTPTLVTITPAATPSGAPKPSAVALTGAATVPTARELAHARALAHGRPAVAVWVDLAVLAHLLALPAAALRPDLMAWLRQQNSAQVRLVIDELTTISVHARTSAIATSHSPAALAQHVVADLNSQLDAQSCPDSPERWRVDAFRYNPLRRALRAGLHNQPGAPRLADSATWEQQLGHPIPGITAVEQLAHIETLSAKAEAAVVEPARLLLGAPAVLPMITGHASNDPRWRVDLEPLLGQLVIPGGWATNYLLGQPL